jgi:hypothetical protein
MNIHGSHGEINKILLKDFVQSNEQEIFQKGSLDQFEIKEKDIGNVRIYLKLAVVPDGDSI